MMTPAQFEALAASVHIHNDEAAGPYYHMRDDTPRSAPTWSRPRLYRFECDRFQCPADTLRMLPELLDLAASAIRGERPDLTARRLDVEQGINLPDGWERRFDHCGGRTYFVYRHPSKMSVEGLPGSWRYQDGSGRESRYALDLIETAPPYERKTGWQILAEEQARGGGA